MTLASNSGFTASSKKPLPSRQNRNEVYLLLFIALVVRVAWMVIAPRSAYSVDLKDWRIVAASLLNGANPYHDYRVLNWPPLWPEILYMLAQVSDRLNWDFFLCVRLTLITIELVLIAAAHGLIRQIDESARPFRFILLGLCLNPLLILLTLQLGNFDALAMVGVLLFLRSLIRFRRTGQVIDWLWAACWLGLGVYAKTFPFILTPLLACGAKRLSNNTRILGAALLAGPALLSMGPLYVLNPIDIWQGVLGYRSTPGEFGVSGLIVLFHGATETVDRYAHFYTMGLMVGLVVLTVVLWRFNIRRDSDLILLAALLLLSLFMLGPGYGPQYWFWVVPLFVSLYLFQSRAYRRLLLWAGIILLVTTLLELTLHPVYGAFIYPWTEKNKIIGVLNWFNDVRNLSLMNVPMFIAALLVTAVGISVLVGYHDQDSAAR
ncbi:MAG: hypothetical protein M3O30_12550 [Planctomycetota bacterium]|nr:hypothetical protein [Planctomycetota bacterium]